MSRYFDVTADSAVNDDGSEGEGGFGVRAKPDERTETALEGGGTCRSADEEMRGGGGAMDALELMETTKSC